MKISAARDVLVYSNFFSKAQVVHCCRQMFSSMNFEIYGDTVIMVNLFFGGGESCLNCDIEISGEKDASIFWVDVFWIIFAH